jgi:glucokinase
MYLGVEIGGTKLQLGAGPGDGTLVGLWRGAVDAAAGGAGIRGQIEAAIPELLGGADLARSALRAVGVGFGGPVDDATRTVVKSHQVGGWDGFPLAEWMTEVTGLTAALGNDADVAGLAEALYGAGQGHSPVVYVTVGSGIGGGLIVGGEIYRGVGRGAAEIGHLRFRYGQGGEAWVTVEEVASGFGIAERVRRAGLSPELLARCDGDPSRLTTETIAEAARAGDALSKRSLDEAWDCLADALCQVIALLCPRRIVIGGGVALMGEELFFAPLRAKVAGRVFRPFAELTEIVPAALGEAVVVHGAIALARRVGENR